MNHKEDMIGRKFCRLTVVAYASDYVSPHGKHWTNCLCRCDCGKMHTALELCVKEMCNYCRNEAISRGLELTCVDGCEAYKIAQAALSEPPRNCDRFADELDAQLTFLNEVWLISVDRESMLERDRYENWTDEMRARYGRWLFAPAAEREGDGDAT